MDVKLTLEDVLVSLIIDASPSIKADRIVDLLDKYDKAVIEAVVEGINGA